MTMACSYSGLSVECAIAIYDLLEAESKPYAQAVGSRADVMAIPYEPLQIGLLIAAIVGWILFASVLGFLWMRKELK